MADMKIHSVFALFNLWQWRIGQNYAPANKVQVPKMREFIVPLPIDKSKTMIKKVHCAF
jgi:hypothetical protein